MLGKIEGRKRGGDENEVVDGITNSMDGHQFQQTLGDSEGQGSMACYSPWDCKESDTTEQLNKKSKDSLHLSIPVNHSDYWEATEKPHTYLHLTLSAHYNCTVWFLVSIWEELTLKTYQALELIRVSSASFLSSHSFRNADVQLYA